MNQYLGTKLINAQPMTKGDYNAFRGWEHPQNEDANEEGFLVEYLDGGKPNVPTHAGYVSWSPADSFAAAYRKTDGLSFGLAVEALKMGKKVARSGWNGKGMFLFVSDKTEIKVVPKTLTKPFIFTSVVYQPHICICDVIKNVTPWVASQTDVLADDWLLVA